MKRILKPFLFLLSILIIILVSIPISKNVQDANYEDKVQKEIENVKEEIANDKFSEYKIDNLETEEARNFAEIAFNDYEKMVQNYPEPEFEIMHQYEIREEIYDLDGEDWTITDWVINTGETQDEFEIKFKATNAEIVKAKSLEPKYGIVEVELEPDEAGIYSHQIPTKKKETDITFIAENKYKKTNIDIIVARPENEKEKQTRLTNEQSQLEWQNSHSGQLCKKYPTWTKADCQNVANNLIWIGMSYEMLLEERGAPDSTNQSNYGYGNEWQWCWWYYDISCFYDDDDDGLIDAYN